MRVSLRQRLLTGNELLARVYHRHKRAINENLGLVIALAASCAAIWTGYEARHARLDAKSAADESLKVQQDSVLAQKNSVDAQIKAMRLEQRPYLRVTPVGFKPTHIAGDQVEKARDGYVGIFKLETHGRTPAIKVDWELHCGLMKSPENLEHWDVSQFRGEARGYIKHFAVANDGDLFTSSCMFSTADFRESIKQRNKGFGDSASRVTFVIIVTYKDLFSDTHHTMECFDLTAQVPFELLSCNDFAPTID